MKTGTLKLFFSALCVIMILSLLIVPAASAKEKGQANNKLPPALAKRDKNGDGKISVDELPASIRDRAMDRFDADRDGTLDAREAAKLASFFAGRNAKQNQPDKRTAARRAAVPAIPTGNIRIHNDIEYAAGPEYAGDKGKLDLYIPKGRRKFPVLFYIHGGGLTSGDKSKGADVAKRFALHGFGVVSTNYRLYPAVKYPSHIKDVAKAFRWVYDNIGKYGGDKNKIFVTGGSAGGQLTALLALDHRYLEEQNLPRNIIKGAIPISGLVDVSRASPNKISKVWSDDPKVVEEASAISHVDRDDPPILIMAAENEKQVRIQQNKDLFEALKKAGHKDATFKVLADRTHNSIRPNLAKEGDPALAAMLEFMKKHGADN